jgi:AraC-like DNA-binding protein
VPESPHVVFLGAPGAVYEEWAPPAGLAPWVAVGWRITCHAAVDLRIVPDGCMDIIGGDVIGSLTRPLTVRLEPGDTSEGIRFHPGGLPALTGVPADELVDQRLPVHELIKDFLTLGRLADDAPRPDPVALATHGARDVRAVSRDSGYSERQVRRRVIAATGHGPKKLMRIARMQEVLKSGRGESWARTAADHGYSDEAHMAHDVADLAGATPHALLG